MDHRSHTSPLLLEKAADRAAVFFSQYRLPFLSSFFFGLLAYGFAITNKLVNHDEVYALFFKGATVVSGRWGLSILDHFFPNYSMPWIYGLFTIFFVSVGICTLVSMFSIRNRLLQGILSGCVMVFPSLIGLFGYMFTSCCFALSFLLAILSAALLEKDSKRYLLPAFFCLVFSLSIYQSYVSVAAGLLVLVLIQRLLTGSSPVSVLKQGIFYVAFLIASMVAYYLCTQAVFRITGTDFGEYAAGYFVFSPASILRVALIAYRNFVRFFTEGFCGLIPTALSRLLHTVLLVAGGILLLSLCRLRKYPAGSILLLVLLLTVLPLAINCMYMITAEESVHTLVLYGFISFYLCILILAEQLLEDDALQPAGGLLLNLVTGILSLVIVINTYISNQAFLNLYLRYENAYAFYTTLAADLKMQPEFTEDAVLALAGTYQQPDYYEKQFADVHSITGINGFLPDDYSKKRFLEYYLGFPVPFASSAQVAEIQSQPEFQEMPVYPYYGSIRSFGDVLVVKLS